MAFELTREFIEELRGLIEEHKRKETEALLEQMHAADIADVFEQISIDEAKYLYLLLDGETAADVIVEMEEDEREKFLKELPSDVIASVFIDNMESDDAADVLGELPQDVKEEVLSHVDDIEQAGDILDLLSYDEDTAGGLMAKELVLVREEMNVEQAIDSIRAHADELDDFYAAYVVDENTILKGILSLQKMLVSHGKRKVADVCKTDVVSVRTDEKSEEVANIMRRYDLVTLPVVDSIGRLMGRITIDDVVDVMQEEAERDYQMISGLSEDVEPGDNILQLTRARLPWLIIGLVGGILGALVIKNYETQLGIYPEMIFFLPLIAAMGGNVGVQSSAIIVQGLASGEMGLDSMGRKLLKEFSVALINGAVCAGLIFTYNIFFVSEFSLTLTVSTALMAVILVASLFGTFVPLMLQRFKIDPALATGPFITTVNDILGLILYLAIGRVFFLWFA